MSRWLPLLLLLSGCIENEIVPNTRPYVPGVGWEGIPEDIGVGALTGQICAPNEITWIVGARVWIEHAYGTAETLTDGEGRFELGPVPAGRQVVHVRKGSFSAEFGVRIYEDLILDMPDQRCLAADLQIAVVTGRYDSVEDLLDHLGFEPVVLDGDDVAVAELLRDPARLEQYDLVFFNCGMGEGWRAWEDEIAANLRDYVEAGGSIYASDWAYWLVERAFPDMLDFVGDDARFHDAARGYRTTDPIQALVHDPDMVMALDAVYADITFDLPEWVGIEAAGDDDDVLIEGTYGYSGHTGEVTGPLAARMAVGEGTVLFTSFHNEAQTTRDMEILLREIILSL